MGALLTPLEPIGIVVGGVVLFGDRFGPARALALALACVGATLAVVEAKAPAAASVSTSQLGNALIACGHLSWALFTLAAKPLLERHDWRRVSLVVTALAIPPVGLLAFASRGGDFDWPAALGALPWVIALALTGSALAVVLWNYALRFVSASTMGMTIFLQPLVGVAAGVFALGEDLDPRAALGASLIVVAVLLDLRSEALGREAAG